MDRDDFIIAFSAGPWIWLCTQGRTMERKDAHGIRRSLGFEDQRRRAVSINEELYTMNRAKFLPARRWELLARECAYV